MYTTPHNKPKGEEDYEYNKCDLLFIKEAMNKYKKK